MNRDAAARAIEEIGAEFEIVETIEQVLNLPSWSYLIDQVRDEERSPERPVEALIGWLRSHLGHRDLPVKTACLRSLAKLVIVSPYNLSEAVDAYLGALRDPDLEELTLREASALADSGLRAQMAQQLAGYLWHIEQRRKIEIDRLLRALGEDALLVVAEQAAQRVLQSLRTLYATRDILDRLGLQGSAMMATLYVRGEDPAKATAACRGKAIARPQAEQPVSHWLLEK